MSVRVVVTRAQRRALLKDEGVRRDLSARADRIAEATLARMGEGTAGEVRVFYGPTDERARYAVWAGHPNPAGRARAREALTASLDAGG